MDSGAADSTTCTSPLAGIRVLDLTSVMLGPYATQMLGDYGANVIKIEAPSGDTTRRTGPGKEHNMASVFLGANRCKRSIVLDLKKPDARDALLKLVDTADVLIHSMRPQKMAALGLAPQVLRDRNPRLVVVAAYGFAQGGPYSGRPAYDDIIQGLCGLASLPERVGGQPAYTPSVIADKTCGLFAAQAVLMALIGRGRTGQASYVEVPMFEAMTGFTLAEHAYGGMFDPPTGPLGYDRLLTPWRRPYPTRDGHLCMVPYTDQHWRSFFAEIGKPELQDDPRFCGMTERTQHIDLLYAMVGRRLAEGGTTAHWLAVCERLDIPAAPLNRLEDLYSDPHLAATDFFKTLVDARMGALRMPRAALRFDGQDAVLSVPPRLGQHTREVLSEAGMDDAAIDGLLSSGAAAQWIEP